jgi:hypothetical protein
VAEAKKKGRPTKYKAEYSIQSEKLCKKGFIDDEIAEFFQVDVATINRWKLAHPAFCESLKKGKKHSDEKVKDALYNRALGYEFTETKEESGDSGKKTTVTTKQMAGDTTAQIFWLKNRQPAEWRNNPEPNEDDDTGKEIKISFEVSEPVSDVKITIGEDK